MEGSQNHLALIFRAKRKPEWWGRDCQMGAEIAGSEPLPGSLARGWEGAVPPTPGFPVCLSLVQLT